MRKAERERIKSRIEARVKKGKATRPESRVQSKVTSYFQQSKIRERMRRDQQELEEARAAVRDDASRDEITHRNIATANNREEREYSRLVSAELMEDENRKHTSENGESSSPQVSWTPESSSSNQAVAWPGPREKQTLMSRYPSVKLDPTLGVINVSTDQSRSPTPQPRVRKPAHRVMAVTDSSEDETPQREAPTHEAKETEQTSAEPQQTQSANSAQHTALVPVTQKHEDMPSEFAKFGQMLLDGKSGKVPTIWQLKFLKDLEKFRTAYEKYTRQVKTYNMTHALAIKAHPVIACVDPDLWISISQQTLEEEHLTEEGEEPNHAMVKAYVLATEPYGDAGKKTTTNIRATLAAVKFAKGPKNSTNMDRWIAYVQRMRPVLKSIPAQQKQSKQYRAMYAEVLRKAVQPSRLKKMVLTPKSTMPNYSVPKKTPAKRCESSEQARGHLTI